MKLSIVLPALNEANHIAGCLAPLQAFRGPDVEIIVVDGGSEDQTATLAEPLADAVISAPAGRARQMNAGWKAARGATIWFLHVDTRVGPEHVDRLLALAGKDGCWGRFDLAIGSPRNVYRLIERAINIRSRASGIATGDQGIFSSRALLEQFGGFPEIELMEDVALSRRLKRIARPLSLRPPVVTSPRRWEEGGVWRTVLLMWRLRLGFFLGADPARLRRIYRDVR